MQPLVSVLMPAYNAEPWIADSLTSALNQTWKNIEIIVVDDGSRDQTLAIARQFAAPNVKVIHQDNQGQSATENRALAAAQGEWIQYLDADDLLAPDKIERQLQKMGQQPGQRVAAGEWARFYKLPEEALFQPQALWADFTPVDWLLTAWQQHLMMHGAAWLIPRPVIEAAGDWDERLSLINDFDYFSRILLASDEICFCWGARSYYRSGLATSLSKHKTDAAWQSAFLSLSQGTANLLQREDSLRSRQVCANLFQRFIYEVYPEVPDLQAQAALQVQKLGGATEQPIGGPLFQGTAKLLGWQKAKHLQRFLYDGGYQKLAVGWKLQRFFCDQQHLKWQKF